MTEQITLNNVRFKGTMKKPVQEFNGLNAVAAEMAAKPLQRYTTVTVWERHSVNDQDGGRTVTARVVQTEVLTNEADVTQATAMLGRAYTARTGAQPAPPTLFDEGSPPAESDDPNVADVEPWPGDAEPIKHGRRR